MYLIATFSSYSASSDQAFYSVKARCIYAVLSGVGYDFTDSVTNFKVIMLHKCIAHAIW